MMEKNLTKRLKSETLFFHKKVESHAWVMQLMNHSLSMKSYYNYLLLMQQIYRPFEQQLKDCKAFVLYQPELARVDKIDSDLRFISTQQGYTHASESMTGASHLQNLDQEKQHYLVSYFYVLYFGQLYGGQIIRKKLQNLFQIPSEALQFYDFSLFYEQFPEGGDKLRETINQLPLSVLQQEDVIQEAKRVFILVYDIMTEALNH